MNIDDLTIKAGSRTFGLVLYRERSGFSAGFRSWRCHLDPNRDHQLGRVKAIGSDFFTLEDGGWVADTGRFGEMLAKGTISEFERAPSWFMVGRGAIVAFGRGRMRSPKPASKMRGQKHEPRSLPGLMKGAKS